jgi:AIPR protein/Abortive infection phage resistance protein N-terminal domain
VTIIDEFINLRLDLLSAAKGADGFVEEQGVLSEALDHMLDATLVDSEDYSDSYLNWESDQLKINGYAVNESGERLRLFIVDERFVDEGLDAARLCVSDRSHYERQFKRTRRFIRLALNGELTNRIQDSDPAKALAVHLSSQEGINQFDVIEVFLVSLSATISRRGNEPHPRNIHFEKEKLTVTFSSGGASRTKEILLLKRVIDLNFLHAVSVSRGNREPLTVNFARDFNTRIEAIQAASDSHFESYLCVLSGETLADLYRLHSSRLLEKNVRSFLQFRGANKGMRETIRKAPEKFIAYNNGLTITATAAEVAAHKKKTYIDSLTDFQIVNGGQTTASIYFSKKDGIDVGKIRVMAKVNIVKSEHEDELDNLISEISRYSNTQSRVSNVDLRSRNPQLGKIKRLSDSITTPSGQKWFFERAKGEFNTILRLAGSRKAAERSKFPPSRRFSKEQLAKYHTAWGEAPYLVKKGGEKVFRHFIEEISPEGNDRPPVNIDRTFYEDLIAKIILFRQMEKIYGQGRGAMGQIRSAAIPYALSCLHMLFDGSGNDHKFNFGLIWSKEDLGDDLREYLRELLQLTNVLIRKYATSDDLGEHSKKPELWNTIKKSKELKEFMSSPNSDKILSHYALSKTPISEKA